MQQAYCFTIESNKTRGNHYHKIKEEIFCCVQGSVIMNLCNIKSGKKEKFILSDKSITSVFVKKNIAHSITNKNKKKAIIVSLSSKVFNEKKPDTYLFNVSL